MRGGRDLGPAGSDFGGYLREGVGFLGSGTGGEDFRSPPMILRRFPEILKFPSFVKISEISDHGARIGRLRRGIGSPGVESGGGGYLGAMGLTPGANNETASDFWGQEQASKTYLAPPHESSENFGKSEISTFRKNFGDS